MTQTNERRRGIVLLYTLSVLMIVMSLGYAYTQTSFSAASGLGSAGLQQLAYQAALSGQSYGTSYIQQMVDSRNHQGSMGGMLIYPSADSGGCGPGFHTLNSMERWAGQEVCAVNQQPWATQATRPCPNGGNGIAGGRELPPEPVWFHYSDVVVPDTNALRYRLWFRLQLTESLTRNGYFYADERDNVYFLCGFLDPAEIPPGVCSGVYGAPGTPSNRLYGMMAGPFTPCGRFAATVQYAAPYPPTDQIIYTLMSTGVVEADPAANGTWAPVAFARVDTGFQIQLGGYLQNPGASGCQEFKRFTPPLTHWLSRLGPREGAQDSSRLVFQNPPYTHAQPYIYFKEWNLEVVRYGPDLPRPGGPNPPLNRAGPPFGP
jgi:hypothetical protein